MKVYWPHILHADAGLLNILQIVAGWQVRTSCAELHNAKFILFESYSFFSFPRFKTKIGVNKTYHW